MTKCTECNNESKVRGYCRACYNRNMRNGTIQKIQPSNKRVRYGKQKCAYAGCTMAARAKGFCNYHYQKTSRESKQKVMNNV